eukprot:UN24785
MYDTGNYIELDGNSLDYVNNCNAHYGGATVHMDYSDRRFFMVMIPNMGNSNTFNIDGGLGADGGGNCEAGDLTTYKGFKGYYKWNCNAGNDPSVNHVMISNAPNATHDWNCGRHSDFDRISNVQNYKVAYLLFAGRSGYCYPVSQFQTYMEAMVDTFVAQFSPLPLNECPHNHEQYGQCDELMMGDEICIADMTLGLPLNDIDWNIQNCPADVFE